MMETMMMGAGHTRGQGGPPIPRGADLWWDSAGRYYIIYITYPLRHIPTGGVKFQKNQQKFQMAGRIPPKTCDTVIMQ